jgi:hypothetical protein
VAIDDTMLRAAGALAGEDDDGHRYDPGRSGRRHTKTTNTTNPRSTARTATTTTANMKTTSAAAAQRQRVDKQEATDLTHCSADRPRAAEVVLQMQHLAVLSKVLEELLVMSTQAEEATIQRARSKQTVAWHMARQTAAWHGKCESSTTRAGDEAQSSARERKSRGERAERSIETEGGGGGGKGL